MYILGKVLILTGWPWYHCGSNFSLLLRVKDAFLLGSYILLSIIPWDSGYSPCNWEYALLQRSKEKEPSSYTNTSFRQVLNALLVTTTPLVVQDWSLAASSTTAPKPCLPTLSWFSMKFKKKIGNLLWDQTERHGMSSHICCIFSTKDKASTYAGPPSHEQKL